MPIVNDSNYTAAGVQEALQGPSEVQTVTLAGYDADGDSFTLNYGGADTSRSSAARTTRRGIQNALQGGNEQQQAILTGFNGATQSFQVELGGNLSAVLGSGGLAISNANVAAAVNAIPGFAGTATSSGRGGGFTLTFAGASTNVDVPSISIVNCTGGCTSSVRELAKGGTGVAGWPAGHRRRRLADGRRLHAHVSGAHQGSDVSLVAVTNGVGVTGSWPRPSRAGPASFRSGRPRLWRRSGRPGSSTTSASRSRSAGASGSSTWSQLASRT